MRSDELRIGNYCKEITHSKNVICCVSNRHFEDIEEGEIDLFPIPLTEEWLLKFGITFKSMGTSGAVCTRHNGHFYYKGKCIMAGSIRKGTLDCFLQCQNEEIDVVYVHQLQNLPQFALTNEELTYTP